MARKGLAKGKKCSVEEGARQKLERHKEKHPELHLEGGAGSKRKGGGLDAALPSKKPHTALEKAIVKGKELKKKGLEVAQGVHDRLGKVHSFVGKGIEATDKVQHGLEQASALAKQGAGLFGEDSDVGKFLLHASTRADAVHEHIGMGLDAAKDFNDKVGKVHDWTEGIHGVHKEGEGPHAHGKRGKKTPLEEAAHLEGKKAKGDHEEHKKKSPHDTGKPQIKTTTETEEQKKARYSRAWTRLGNVAVDVNMFEKRYGKTMPKIREMMAKGQTQQASLELMGLGSNCDAVSKSIKEALELSKGNEKYEKQARFFADWHKEMKAKLHAAIADTKGLGNDTQISGFGISEATHPDIFQNTREIFAIQAKVIAFGDALSDTDAHEHVKKVLADAKKAKSELQALKTKYKKDKKA